MAGYIGSKSSVTLVDGYSEAEADAEFVNDPSGAITVSGSNVGIGTSSPSNTLSLEGSGTGLNINSTNDEVKKIAFENSGVLTGYIGSSTSSPLRFLNGSGTERMRIDSSGNVGIGTSSPAGALHANSSGHTRTYITSGTSSDAQLNFGDSDDNDIGGIHYDNAQNSMKFRTNASERMRIVSSGNVGIGTSSPEGKLHVYSDNVGTPSADADDFIIEKTGDTGLSILSTSTGRIYFGDASSNDQGSIRYIHGDNSMRFETDSAERMRIDSSGNVGIGTTSPAATSSTYKNLQVALGATVIGRTDDSPLYLSSNLSYDSDWKYFLNTTATQIRLDTNVRFFTAPAGTAGNTATLTERMRIDSSGNVLVGTTTTVPHVNGSGVAIRADEGVIIGVDGKQALIAARHNSNGEVIRIQRDNSTVGSIGINGGSNRLTISGAVSGLYFGGGDILPTNSSGTPNDNAVDLGSSGVRWDDVYATNGTINTSDFNDKQDIASLTATEMLVGKRISALFKTFRWKDSVAEKGDNARTHTGVIAQDVQAAFTAEGLDAGDYALFISSTWWETQTEVPAVEAVTEVTDEDGNVTTEAVEAVDAYTDTDVYKTEDEAPEGATERTRLGIRYPELLSFVAAYNEQRFASIEARLTALEA